MPRERPRPEPFEPEALERSLNRYLVVGLVFMALLIAGFVAYRVREPTLRADATASQHQTYTKLGAKLFADNCASCHGDEGTGGERAHPELKGVPLEHLRPADPRPRLGRRVGHRHGGVGSRLWRHPDR